VTDYIIKAADLQVGDTIVDGHLWRVDVVSINPRRKCGPKDSDLLVDVDATSLDCEVKAQRFASYKTDEMMTIRRGGGQ